MKPIDDEIKATIVADARTWVATVWPSLPMESSCLYMTIGVVAAAKTHGIQLLPQAGSVSWLAVAPHEDDGKRSNAASYMWDPGHPLSKLSLAHGFLPEMHCWAADPERMEIVDATTGFQMERFATLLEWSAEPLPDYLWGKPRAGWHYTPHRDACELAFRYMRNALEALRR